MVLTHGGAAGIVGLLVDSEENVIARLRSRIVGERVPLFGAVPGDRQAPGDRTLRIFDVDLAGFRRTTSGLRLKSGRG